MRSYGVTRQAIARASFTEMYKAQTAVAQQAAGAAAVAATVHAAAGAAVPSLLQKSAAPLGVASAQTAKARASSTEVTRQARLERMPGDRLLALATCRGAIR